MKAFSAYLAESEHKGGTYAALSVSFSSQNKIKQFIDKFLEINKDATLVDPAEYHCTLIYSRNPCPDVKHLNPTLPISAIPIGFELFESKSESTLGSMCLVLLLDSDDLRNLEKKCRDDYGASSDFPSYKPHISLVYGYTGEKPKKDLLKNLKDIELDKFNVEPLASDWNS